MKIYLEDTYPQIAKHLAVLRQSEISDSRKELLNQLVQHLNTQIENKAPIVLNFICTHNSRRSQMARIWAHFAAYLFQIPIKCFSGGVEVTSFNERAANAIRQQGFKVESDSGSNPEYQIRFSDHADPIIAFSKLFDDPENNSNEFAAVMTCSDVDDQCPYIPSASVRIPLYYEDPKAFDDGPEESEMYLQRANQIATEMLYVFTNLKHH